MKQLTTIILTVLFSGMMLVASAQSKSYRLYNEFSNNPACSQFSFSKSMLDVVNLTVDEEGKKVTGDLNEVRFLSYNPEKGKMSGSDFLKQLKSLLPSSYQKIKLDGEKNDMEVFILGNKKKATECHLFFKSSNQESIHFLVSFYGNFNIEDIDKLENIGKNFSVNGHE